MTSLIAAVGRSGDATQALNLFNTMREQGTTPNQVTWNTLLSVLGKEGSGKLQYIIDQMKKEGVKRDLVTWNTLISLSGDLNESFCWFEEMEKEGVTPDACTWNTVMSLTERQVIFVKLYNYFIKMKKKGTEPDQTSWNLLFWAIGRCGTNTQLLQEFCNMQATGYQADRHVWTTLISCCAHQGNVEESIQNVYSDATTRIETTNHDLYCSDEGLHCGKCCDFGSKIHMDCLKLGLMHDVKLQTAVLNM